VERLRDVAAQLGVSVAQAAIAWVGGDDIVPVVGARTRQRLDEALGANNGHLTDQQLAAIESAVPKGSAAGDRYDAHQMALLDSER
jgi:aryl-alcohol dehydrogenase-like predicted oxidoreductase